MLRRAPALGLLSLLTATAACSDRRPPPPPASRTAPASAAPAPAPAPAPAAPPPRTLATLDVAAVSAALPVITGAVDLTAPRAALGGRQVQRDQCLAAPTLDAAAGAVEATLQRDGWSAITRRGIAPRIGLAARRGDLQLSIAVSPSPRVGCDPGQQQWLVSTMVHAPGAAAAAAAAALEAATADGAQVIH